MDLDSPRLGNSKGGERAYARYSQFMYTSDEAKRLLSMILADNWELVKKEPHNSPAYSFLKKLGVVDLKQEDDARPDGAAFDTASGSHNTVNEYGKILGDVALVKSFAVAKSSGRSGTLMHTMNATFMRGSGVTPEMQRNADYLSMLSGIVRNHETFPSLNILLDKICPDWSSGFSQVKLDDDLSQNSKLENHSSLLLELKIKDL